MATGDLEWMEDAACRQRPDLDWFDIDCNLEPCLATCAICPVANECLNYAVRNGIRDGLWGGEWGHRLERAVQRGGGLYANRLRQPGVGGRG